VRLSRLVDPSQWPSGTWFRHAVDPVRRMIVAGGRYIRKKSLFATEERLELLRRMRAHRKKAGGALEPRPTDKSDGCGGPPPPGHHHWQGDCGDAPDVDYEMQLAGMKSGHGARGAYGFVPAFAAVQARITATMDAKIAGQGGDFRIRAPRSQQNSKAQVRQLATPRGVLSPTFVIRSFP